jgi:hypothetical protein
MHRWPINEGGGRRALAAAHGDRCVAALSMRAAALPRGWHAPQPRAAAPAPAIRALPVCAACPRSAQLDARFHSAVAVRGCCVLHGAQRGPALLVAYALVTDLPALPGPHAQGACCYGAAARAARRSAGSERGRGGRGGGQTGVPWRLFQPRRGAEEPQRVPRGRTSVRARDDWPAELRQVRYACALVCHFA